MAKFTIYSPNGAALYTGTPTFTGQYMKPGLLEFREISTPNLIDFSAGCYVGYDVNGTVIPQYSRTGYTYKLYSVPQVKKQARQYSYGAAFVYQGVQFFDASKELELCPFRDLVLGDNRIHFSTQPSISTFEGCDGLARRFEACLREQYDVDGERSWQVRIATTSDGVTPEFYAMMTEPREFTVSGINILECLDKIYEIWPEVGWVYTVETVDGAPTNTIIIGGAGLNANQGTYAYGKGKGLTSITRTVANADEMANRIYAYGSSRNMLPKWYNRQAIKDAQSVDIQNLMIPIVHWGTTPVGNSNLPDASKAYVENTESIDRIGLRPKTIYFDGTGEYPEIYPSIRKKTIGDLWSVMSSSAQYYPKSTIYSSGDRIDTVLSAQESYDSGLAGNTPGKANVEMGDTPFSASNSFTMLAGETYYPFYHYQGTWMPDTEGIQTVAWKLDISGQVQLDGIEMVVVSVKVKDPSYQGPVILSSDYALTPDANGVVTLVGKDMIAEKVNVIAVSYVVSVEMTLYMTAQETDKTCYYALDGNVGFALQNYRKKTFNITLRQLGFDINAQAALGEGKTIAMRSGKCQGRVFTIKSVQYNSANDAWSLECFRSEDESLSQWFPNTDYPIRGLENAGQSNEYPGDEFVLLDIAMPELYVILAENELYQAAQDLLSDTSVERWQYVPEIDAKFMVENARVIRSGEYMAILDMDLIEAAEGTASYFKTSSGVYLLTSNGEKIRLDDGSGSVTTALVDTIVINEGEAVIPTYKVTLRDRKRKTWTESKGADAPSSKSVGSIKESQAAESSGGGDSFFRLDEQGNITLKQQYQNLWVPGWMAAGGVGDDEGGGGGGGGVSSLRELSDVYHNGSNVLRANGTSVQPGDALVYDSTHGWVAAVQSGGVSSVVLSAGSSNGTLKLTVNGVAGSDVSIPGLGSLAYKNSLSASDIPSLNYLPLSGGELSGDLRLKGSSNYGRTLRFGDGDYAYIKEDTDDHLKIYGENGIELSTGTGYGIKINGEPIGTITDVTLGGNSVVSNNVAVLPAYPTTLPASDVYAWAKAATKPSYTLDEITDGTNRKLSDYLPLSGGTMTGNIVMSGASIVPSTNNTSGLGTSSARFANIYGVNENLSGDLSLSSSSHIDIGPVRIKFENNAIHITKKDPNDTNNYGIYADGFVSAGGVGQTS